MSDPPEGFGVLLSRARKAAGLSRPKLADRVGLDPSHVYRVELGGRRPSRDAVIAFAEALDMGAEVMNRWLAAAGYETAPLVTAIRQPVRVRGLVRNRGARETRLLEPSAARWATWLDEIGLDEHRVQDLLRAMDGASAVDRRLAARAISTAFTRVTGGLRVAVRTAVIPAAGREHRLLAPEVMQLLLVRSIREAVDAGVTKIVLVLPPGGMAALHSPIAGAASLSVIPPVRILGVEQSQPDGLGRAILQASSAVGTERFAVLLPDDVVEERRRGEQVRDLQRMVGVGQLLPDSERSLLLAVTEAPRTKLGSGGVARLGEAPTMPGVFRVEELAEKPEAEHPILHSPMAFRIVGRYILNSAVAGALRELDREGRRPLHLTDALERLRREGHVIYAYELEGKREDLGELLNEVQELIGTE